MYDFDKVLLKPNIEPMDGNTQRIRRNLMIVAVIAFFFSIGSQGIDVNSSFVGIRFEGLQPKVIQLLLLLTLLYFLLHFLWASLDHLKENWFRLTGIAIPMARSGTYAGSNYTLEPNTGDARQSTIHSWWMSQRAVTISYKGLLESIESKVKEGNHEQAVNALRTRLDELEHIASYIEEAMLRYENGFWIYQRSQLVRWLILDFGVPLGIGAASVFLIGSELYKAFMG